MGAVDSSVDEAILADAVAAEAAERVVGAVHVHAADVTRPT